MGLIEFTSNYEDLSTDKGFQFKFFCDKCGNGFMSEYDLFLTGTASSLLRAAGELLGGGLLSSAGNSAYEIQRAIGGKAHDAALKAAVEEGKKHFRHCTRCGSWVCPDACWNEPASLCEQCAPDYQEQIAANHAQAKAEAAREQIHDKARKTDYASTKKMGEDDYERATSTCPACGTQANSKFCPECGGQMQVHLTCPGCGHQPQGTPKFCPECGARMRTW